eukprot:CAMPEP_0117668898 /NCGR_PEP_ID=MMETSP0804-20121206/11817_1 /TAXON_ID=1074897 /ORGANISM="Tetraselmis astigmatica, Strain CCMP880" /LENGTH=70 /DNA_ID=CAMNT_0005476865 /DNA_START=233 /DNA_END=445 /DNA_ORIENTATION=+
MAGLKGPLWERGGSGADGLEAKGTGRHVQLEAERLHPHVAVPLCPGPGDEVCQAGAPYAPNGANIFSLQR